MTTNLSVFIFGSNGQGFHGAGAAAYAFCGKTGNVWRSDPLCQRAIQGHNSCGVMAEWGVSRGFQMGSLIHKASYAIQTVQTPGKRGNLTLADIQDQVHTLIAFMRKHPEWTFATTRFGAGLAGWPVEVMEPLWDLICAEPNGRMAEMPKAPR